ncbi:GPI transamidase subunit PIG-U [Boletus edulis BED1]|uniref:GPI transamidase subunit PIG-U n=1 Tax=Boletus edulis BED1 TaxID=1328754 RepID=A0AAD4GHY1_BOLED|nr:GPI transamidase subunit PIG-U [Boletus edulis BED1]
MDSTSLFPLLVSFRLLLACIPLHLISGLQHDHQLSSPLTSYSRLKEGLWLYSHNIDPYAGGVFRHSPLFLSIFSTLLPPLPIVWALSDIVGAWALLRIWRARQRVGKGSGGRAGGLVAAAFLLNPYLFLPSLALSASTFENTAVLLTLMFASEGKPSAALLALAFSTHLCISTLLLLLPVLMLLVTSPVSQLASPQEFRGDLRTTCKYAGQFVAYWLVLLGASSLMVGDVYCEQSYRASLTLPDLTPNPGLWWYFFTEMFDHFRPFFLMVFSVHLVIYILPICIKFQHDALYASFLLVGILGIFKAYLTLADPGLFLSMFALFPEVYPYLRHPIVTTLVHIHAALLLPLFHALWVTEGRGNANFYYAASLVMGVAGGMGVVDACYAGLRIAFGDVAEGERNNWAVVQE